MRTRHLSTSTLVVGILGVAIGACSSPTSSGTGSGGTPGAEGGSGGTSNTGGSASGGTSGSGGTTTTGGTTTKGTGGEGTGGGKTGAGGRTGGGGRTTMQGTGGSATPDGAVGLDGAGDTGSATDGRTGPGGRDGGTAGSTGTAGAPGTGGRTTPGTGTGTCTASKSTGKNVSGSGPHKVVMEMNSDAGIKCGTIYRPEDLGAEKYPIFVWGEGGCSQDGTSNQAALGEIASYGFFVVADGVASGTACSGGQSGKSFLDYITWAIAENDKSCSAYYQSLDTTKIAADGFSCGGLMAENVSGDPRFTAIGITSSGLQSASASLYDKIHTPFKIMNGGSGDMAYQNGLRDYEEISKRGIPIVYFSQSSAGHGGDLTNAKGTFNTVNLAWLKWQLKGDEGETGKGLLIGANCKYCKASGWEFKSANIQ